jgi:hypothetical protein
MLHYFEIYSSVERSESLKMMFLLVFNNNLMSKQPFSTGILTNQSLFLGSGSGKQKEHLETKEIFVRYKASSAKVET